MTTRTTQHPCAERPGRGALRASDSVRCQGTDGRRRARCPPVAFLEGQAARAGRNDRRAYVLANMQAEVGR